MFGPDTTFSRFSFFASAVLLLFCSLFVGTAWATPTQFGVSGLLGQPSADTLESGNISIGLWVNGSQQGAGDGATILPFSLTMGLGSFIESYGSFPNLLFNNEEDASGRGYANLGFKVRVLGKRSSPAKLALDLQARRHISDDAERDGKTDLLARAVTTYKKGRFGFHLNAGYLLADSNSLNDNQIITGAAIEYFPVARLRLIAELEGATARMSGRDEELELLGGLQYFYSPHLTLHAGFGTGLTADSADWRFIAGVSTSQGIGTFTKPVPQIIKPVLPEDEEKPEKKAKFKTITPLLPMSRLAKPAPTIKGEMPVNPGEEKVLVEPDSQLTQAKGVAPILPQATPISTPAPERIVKKAEPFRASEPIPTVVYRKFRFEDVNFAFDQHSLSETGLEALHQVAESLRKERKWFLIRIDGHTDAIGSEDYNDRLSYRRAVAVGQQLVTLEGFDPARIFVKGFGESSPVASNKTAVGREKNRRAEILVLLPEKG